jgi:hypothetical protein
VVLGQPALQENILRLQGHPIHQHARTVQLVYHVQRVRQIIRHRVLLDITVPLEMDPLHALQVRILLQARQLKATVWHAAQDIIVQLVVN